MTVTELRKALEDVPGELEVLMYDNDGSPYFLQKVTSSVMDTVLTKPSPYLSTDIWFWHKNQSNDGARSGGAEIKIILIS